MKRTHLLIGLLALCLFGSGSAQESTGRYHALRLHPGQDVKKELSRYVKENDLRACAVVTCVGSLTEANIRYANEPGGSLVEGPLELVTVTGCGGTGGWHLHIAVSDKEGRTTGGHLMDGSIVRTTVEIVLVELSELEFHRIHDPESGYRELEVRDRSPKE